MKTNTLPIQPLPSSATLQSGDNKMRPLKAILAARAASRANGALHRTYQPSLHNFLVLRELCADENNQTNLDSDKSC
jgi:hypothetical protein